MDANEIAKISLKFLKYTNPITWAVIETVEKSIEKTNEISTNGSVEELQKIALKQKIEMQMAESQAKVAQEIAIARRIDTAEEVIIEEYYEGDRKGKIGLNTEESNLNFGLSGSGRKISKRVYIFKGWRDGGLETLYKTQNSDSNEI